MIWDETHLKCVCLSHLSYCIIDALPWQMWTHLGLHNFTFLLKRF